MNILSIQSWVAYGHVGNASAVFPLQRLGHEVWAVDTVQFSNHTGYGSWRGDAFSAEAIREVVLGVEERGAFARCDGALSGYMGGAAVGEAILDALARAASSIYGVLKATAEAGSREILTVAAQEEFVRPSRRFEAEPVCGRSAA